MKTTQGRSLVTTTIIFLVALLILGLGLQVVVRGSLTDSAYDRLDDHSQTMSKLAAAYYAYEGKMETGQFIINLHLAARVSETDAIICNAKGQVLLFVANSDGEDMSRSTAVQEDMLFIPQKYLDEIATAGCVHYVGNMRGIYTEKQFISARPVKLSNDQVVGYVLSSVPTAETERVLTRVSNMFIWGAILVMAISVLSVAFFAKRQNHFLENMAQKARAFGHGDLEARVHITGNEPKEVEELAIAFNNMASSLQKSEYSRQEFVANVSHELKTPMTTIGGYVDGILDGTIPPEKAQYYMQIVSAETKRLARLVRSMLDVSQLQSEGGIPAEQLTRFDVEECAGKMLITFEKKITDKCLQVDVDMPECPIYTVAQQDYISQVIYNLLDNAVKFCPTEGRLSLKIRESENKIYVSVGNDGQTIPPEELPLLFDRFHKMDKSRAENRDGWGLGLYIVKTIVGLHGEDITATSQDGFTEFTFTLPLMS